MDGDVLRAERLEEWSSYTDFDSALARHGPWMAGIDFPFGQSRRFIETIGWPLSWSGYVATAAGLGREGFRSALTAYRETRPAGDKEHRRATDKAARSISPQKLYGVPVGLMFFEGAPRLLASGVTIPFLQQGDADRTVVEAYPGVLARALIGRRSYKNDSRSKQTADQREARFAILHRLIEQAPACYGFAVEAPPDLCEDPGADHLDALLCAVQAAWAWSRRDERFGAPANLDPLEGGLRIRMLS